MTESKLRRRKCEIRGRTEENDVSETVPTQREGGAAGRRVGTDGRNDMVSHNCTGLRELSNFVANCS